MTEPYEGSYHWYCHTMSDAFEAWWVAREGLTSDQTVARSECMVEPRE